MNSRKTTEIVIAREKIQAFMLYLQGGMPAVERRYPQHKKFVEENSKQTYRSMKEALSRVSVHR